MVQRFVHGKVTRLASMVNGQASLACLPVPLPSCWRSDGARQVAQIGNTQRTALARFRDHNERGGVKKGRRTCRGMFTSHARGEALLHMYVCTTTREESACTCTHVRWAATVRTTHGGEKQDRTGQDENAVGDSESCRSGCMQLTGARRRWTRRMTDRLCGEGKRTGCQGYSRRLPVRSGVLLEK